MIKNQDIKISFIIGLLLLALLQKTAAQQPRSYYFATAGDDNKGLGTRAAPYKTLQKLNALSRTGADSFFLKRGDVFTGPLQPARGKIYIGAYGTGAQPLITGFVTLSSWRSAGSGLWEAPLDAGTRLNVVVINNQPQHRGRYPNLHAPGGGFLHYESHNGFSSVTDNNYPGPTDWPSGGTAELCLRSQRFMLNVYPLTSQSGGTFSYPGNGALMQDVLDRFGYFIQNDPRTLDENGEWFYQPATHQLKMYSTKNPSTLAVRAATLDTLVNLNNLNEVTLENLAITGANKIAVFMYGGASNKIINCSISYTGMNAIEIKFTKEAVVRKNQLFHIYNNAVYAGPLGDGLLIDSNSISNIGLIRGEGMGGNLSHLGIFVSGNNAYITNNRLNRIGYHGIATTHSGAHILYNQVDSAAMMLDDAGGIYTSEQAFKPGAYRWITGNLVTNIIGNSDGIWEGDTSKWAHGIYFDEASEWGIIDSNTIANTADRGIYIHDGNHVKIRYNKIYNAGKEALSIEHDRLQPNMLLTGMEVKHNLFVSPHYYPTLSANQPTNSLMSIQSDTDSFSTLMQWGVSDSNYFCKPFYLHNTNDFFKASYNLHKGNSQSDSTYTIKGWQKLTRQDLHSKVVGDFKAAFFSHIQYQQYPAGNFNAGIAKVINQYGAWSSLNHDRTAMDTACLRVDYTGNSPRTQGYAVFFSDESHTEDWLKGHTYVVSFDIKSNLDIESDFFAVVRSTKNTPQSQVLRFKINGTRKHVDLIFTMPHTVEKHYVVLYNQAASKGTSIYIDNFSEREATVTYTNPADYLVFKWATDRPVRYSKSQVYVNEKGERQGAQKMINRRQGELFILGSPVQQNKK
ncbi:MAG: right-handed parallel beta-helix repeat-containing protein [Williamsia sp.]|nr:right-handed parallel beta-helix repeat-containing protein [Williamsia sp.]